MKVHRLNNGLYSVEIKGLKEKFITSSWADAMKIAWALGGAR